MTDGSNSPEMQTGIPRNKYNVEEIQFGESGQLVKRITGEKGTVYVFGRDRGRLSQSHDKTVSLDPTGSRHNEGVVRTTTGDYLITHGHGGYNPTGLKTVVIDIGKTQAEGKLIAAITKEPESLLPQVKFGEPWEIPGFTNSGEVKELLLYSGFVPLPGRRATVIDEEDPSFAGHRLMDKYRMDVNLGKVKLYEMTPPEEEL